MAIILSPTVQAKLNVKHDGVTADEIRQCFANLEGTPMIDHRARHLTNPVTRWFIAETDYGRQIENLLHAIPEWRL
jgi:hypothetical protein